MAAFNILKMQLVNVCEFELQGCDICGVNCKHPIFIDKKYKIDTAVICECSHSFHKHCIEKSNNICKTCNTRIIIKRII